MIKLLLIEDDINLCYILKSSLEELIGDYEVTTASNGEEGLQILASNYTPDIIVSDVDMPVLNGLDMVKQIRKSNVDISIIFASAKNTAKDVTLGYESGVDNYIKKTFLPEELDAHIKAVLRLKQNTIIELKEQAAKIGSYIFEHELYYLEYDSKKQRLTSRESQILKLLYDNKGQIM